VLLLVNGEPAVWACRTAGIFNVTCTLAGENALPGWLIPELHRLAVTRVIGPPDCDDTGRASAGKLRDRLRDSGITLTCPALPLRTAPKRMLTTCGC